MTNYNIYFFLDALNIYCSFLLLFTFIILSVISGDYYYDYYFYCGHYLIFHFLISSFSYHHFPLLLLLYLLHTFIIIPLHFLTVSPFTSSFLSPFLFLSFSSLLSVLFYAYILLFSFLLFFSSHFRIISTFSSLFPFLSVFITNLYSLLFSLSTRFSP